MDTISRVREQLVNERINVKELFEKFSEQEHDHIESFAVTKYRDIRDMIIREYEYGYMTISEYDLMQDHFNYLRTLRHSKLKNIIIQLLTEDGFYIESQDVYWDHNNNVPGYLIAWDDRAPAVKYRVDGPEYCKMKELLSKEDHNN